MDMRAALRDRLVDDPGVAAIVGTRISWITRPQGADLPAVTLQVVSGDYPQHLKNWEKAQARVQFDAWATSLKTTADAVQAAKAALAPAVDHEGIRFSRMLFESEVDFQETLETGDVFRTKIELVFAFQSTT